MNARSGALIRDGMVRARVIVVAIFIAFALSALTSAVRKDVTTGFDELAHVSYVAELQVNPGPVALDRLRLLDPKTFSFTSKASYLNHADPYYRLMAMIGPRIAQHPAALVWHRAINVAIVAAGFALMLAAMIALARTGEEQLIFAFSLACVPVLPQMAGSVNNDNLAFLGGGILIFGVRRFLDKQRTTDLIISGLGVIIAGAAKLTGLMLGGGFFIAVMAIAWLHGFANRRQIGLAVVALAIGALPAVGLWIDYGSPAPDTVAQAALLRQGAQISGWASQPRLGALAYVAQFLRSFVADWMPTLTTRSSFQIAMLIIPMTAIAMGVGGTVRSAQTLTNKGQATPYSIIVCAGALAIAVTMIIHITFSYQRHLATGWMMDAFPRYYLPLIEIIPLAGVALFRTIKRDSVRVPVASFLLISPIVFRLLG